MTNEQKELLLKDISARLPYGVKCQIQEDEDIYIGTLRTIEVDDKNGHLLDFIEPINGLNCQVYLSEIKPYLFPLSSMTIEEKYECPFKWSMIDAWIDGKFYLCEDEELNIDEIINMFNWLNKKHFDYRGLIPMGLAKDATGLDVYKK